MIQQCTIQQKTNISGIGIHNGKKVNLILEPAKINTGIVFIRNDININYRIKADWTNVFKTILNTSIKKNNIIIGTIEHLMSALSALKIDNIIIRLDNDEVPILDGSSQYFAKMIQKAGIQKQTALKKFIRITNKISIHDKDKLVSL